MLRIISKTNLTVDEFLASFIILLLNLSEKKKVNCLKINVHTLEKNLL